MTVSEELVISAAGDITIRTIPKSYSVLNRDAVMSQLLGPPSFKARLTEKSVLMYKDSKIYVLTHMEEFDLTTEWCLREDDNGVAYESPVFESSGGELTTRTSRIYTPPLPTVMINSFGPEELESEGSISSGSRVYLLGTSTWNLPEPAEQPGQDVRRFHLLPLANTGTDGNLCTGDVGKFDDLYTAAVTSIEKWNINNWQGDLWRENSCSEKRKRCDSAIKYDPVTHKQLDVVLGDGETLDDLFIPVVPNLDSEVLQEAWKVANHE